VPKAVSEARFDARRRRAYPTAAMNPAATASLEVGAKVIDHSRCIGCHACTTACKSEKLVPISVTRTYVKYVDVGSFRRRGARSR
jgi:Fe-S-cluster-containing dehydrogenase component